MLHITLSTGHIIEVEEFAFIQNNEVCITTAEDKQTMFEICISIEGSKYISSTNTFTCNFESVENIRNIGK